MIQLRRARFSEFVAFRFSASCDDIRNVVEDPVHKIYRYHQGWIRFGHESWTTMRGQQRRANAAWQGTGTDVLELFLTKQQPH